MEASLLIAWQLLQTIVGSIVMDLRQSRTLRQDEHGGASGTSRLTGTAKERTERTARTKRAPCCPRTEFLASFE